MEGDRAKPIMSADAEDNMNSAFDDGPDLQSQSSSGLDSNWINPQSRENTFDRTEAGLNGTYYIVVSMKNKNYYF